jgi:hypothetical protein
MGASPPKGRFLHTTEARRTPRATEVLFFCARWAALTLAGALVYVQARALWTAIVLGQPWYDWQWYLALSLALLAVLLRAAGVVPGGRAATASYALLLLWIAAGYRPPGIAEHVPVGEHPTALNFFGFGDFLGVPDTVLDDLGAAHATLYLQAPTRTFDDDAADGLAAGLRRLDAHGVDVVLMPLLSDFFSVPVADEWTARTRLAAAFVRREQLRNVRGLLADAEPPLYSPHDPNLEDRAGFERARQEVGATLADIRRDYPDLPAGVTANWASYVDGFDGDPDMAFIMRAPVDPPGGWQFYNLMTYTSYFPAEERAYDVWLMERGLARRYPDARISHLIGLVGGGFPGEPVLPFDDLVRDARLSRGMGVREIVVFQLNGALQQFGDDFVARFVAAVEAPEPAAVDVPFARGASVACYAVVLLDALLDLRGPAGWGVLACGALAALFLQRVRQRRV